MKGELSNSQAIAKDETREMGILSPSLGLSGVRDDLRCHRALYDIAESLPFNSLLPFMM